LKSKIFSLALVFTLTAGVSVFAQGRGGGRPAGVGGGQGTVGRPADAGRDQREPQNRSTEGEGGIRRDQRNDRVATELNDNPQLRTRLQSMLPPGTDLNSASSGFKNSGQFVAAVHVSNNLGIPFDQLRTKMVDGDMSLGKAVEELRPDLSKDAANKEVKKAEEQAKHDNEEEKKS
jgi:hypothetical protein